MSETIHTVGHSTHTSEAFISLLIPHRITAVADVRSTPYSRRNPQFNREAMRDALKVHGIRYVYLGRELGARSEDDCCYVNDKVRYSLLAQTPLFRSGIERLLDGARSQRIALVCAERDPLDCHRTILIARELVRCGVSVLHILSDGSIEPHDDALRRLVGRLRMGGDDLFRSQSITLEEAYDRQAARIAFDRKRHRAGLRSPTFNETEVP